METNGYTHCGNCGTRLFKPLVKGTFRCYCADCALEIAANERKVIAELASRRREDAAYEAQRGGEYDAAFAGEQWAKYGMQTGL